MRREEMKQTDNEKEEMRQDERKPDERIGNETRE